ncbi:MAG: benzoate/H(+) symporter BenE family transporter [Cyanobacteria bacterium P01_D01_bin.14]
MLTLQRFIKDFSLSALVTGFVTVLVGFTSAAVFVFQAAQSLGATSEELASWMGALGLGMGLTCGLLSLRYRVPVVTAWSTPGAALLITSTAGISMPEAIGAFLFSAMLMTVSGFSGWFERAMNRVPTAIASAMLAGVLLRFGMEAFTALQTQFAMVFAMICAYLLGRRLTPRYTIIAALAVGILVAGFQGLLRPETLTLQLARPVFTAPRFSLNALVGVALPLFAVTMASQNIPGVAILRASGYAAPVSPLIGWTGLATLLLAPFGAFAINLSSITAAICMGREAHEDPKRRYVAAVSAGLAYLIVGLFGATVGAVFVAFPQELVLAIAGLALLGTIGRGLAAALTNESTREPALITFLVTASGLSLLGVGSAFWGLVAGGGAIALLQSPTQPES